MCDSKNFVEVGVFKAIGCSANGEGMAEDFKFIFNFIFYPSFKNVIFILSQSKQKCDLSLAFHITDSVFF